MAGKRSKSSDRWLRRQRKDYFVRTAQKQGQVSRAHFKLEQLDRKFKLLTRRSRVLELGAAPGGWTSYIESKLSKEGGLIAVDPLLFTAGNDTEVIIGSVGEEAVDVQIASAVERLGELDLVLSDMAPNMSGIRSVDQARSMELADVAFNAAARWLRRGGGLVLKAFQGEGLDDWVAARREVFKKVVITKPQASRSDSREVFVVAQGFSGKRDPIGGLV